MRRIAKHPRLLARSGTGARTSVRFTAAPPVTWMLALCFALFPLAAQAASLVIIPESITLNSPAARQPLVVERITGKQLTGQVTNAVQLISSDTNVVRIENGVAVPVRDGRATIRAKAGRDTAWANVLVRGMTQPFDWSFRNHVIPVMTKAGCNQGACHGALAGKNGFKLTLRGYDPDQRAFSLA